jgi:hypothetical protein
MELGKLIIVAILLLPILLVSVVWWFWTRRRPERSVWRQNATLISVTAATAGSAILLGLLGWANFFAFVAPAPGHPM